LARSDAAQAIVRTQTATATAATSTMMARLSILTTATRARMAPWSAPAIRVLYGP